MGNARRLADEEFDKLREDTRAALTEVAKELAKDDSPLSVASSADSTRKTLASVWAVEAMGNPTALVAIKSMHKLMNTAFCLGFLAGQKAQA